MFKFCFSAKSPFLSFLLPLLVTLLLTACDSNSPVVDQDYIPFADAGENQTTNIGATIALDSSGSYDNEGQELSYSWVILEKPEGSEAQLDGSSFIPDMDGKYILQLVVNNGTFDSQPDTVTITVGTEPEHNNTKPIANAGDDKTFIVDDLIVLDGSLSNDPDGDTISYQWAFSETPEESQTSLNTPNNVTTNFNPDSAGIYLIELTVNDGTVNSDIDIVKITVNAPQICDPNTIESKDCTITNGLGTQSRACNTDGLAWNAFNSCTITSCNNGYHKDGNSCVIDIIPPAQVCTPNSIESKSCTIQNGSGIQSRSCKTDGLAWNAFNSCTVTNCNNGYHKTGNTCVIDAPAQLCSPHSTESKSCTITNGSGTQSRSCNTEGLAWSAYNSCTINSCNSGYHKVGNTCVIDTPAQACTPHSTDSKSCTIANGSGAQSRACNTDGLAWGAYDSCTVNSCISGYHKAGNTCVIDTPAQVCTPNLTESKSCTITNGSGAQSRACNADGLAWGAYNSCTVNSCDNGYHKVGNTCVIDSPAQVCTPNLTESKSCTITNGSGAQSRACNADGLAWSAYDSCTVNSCNSGYHKVGNTCVIALVSR